MARARFITLEGIEGCGKSTQAKRLVANLKSLGIEAVLTLEPGGTDVGRDIRRILLDFRNQDLSPLSELFLYEADRAQHVAEVVKPALASGRWVVCDRFFDATTVYQGYARGQDTDLIRMLNKKASQEVAPDMTFLMDCPVGLGLERALRRNEAHMEPGQDRFEREARAFHEAVREGYLFLARAEAHRFRVIDATLDPKDVEMSILDHVKALIQGDGDGGKP
jgi:dTMP kinase